ncbi:putative P-loop containing nucleoside triphosphate hydrolase [Helianthus annuus]|uniref:P-loop containing nucleoside triphosphate hydrolase n=1 Tax=Helianthus annuus TaxID=4232 RepID=A0A9K3HB20_HELAN|nr:putative P-loop containing nucleoside triphosphate hydrolase [Helianthus annuus]KAJ0475647.1 putative P-loop containing nucleoside triphosphate hydrolase [Helianthus annuus]KAJ0496430.1 putative P-loop containing nucleoside triphosphate hydrolase [Helianthus annuus]KAJ0662488.1 putative P-loop containing nucleoside triphosphate hydrolase [Helianthus annuus]KAJ0670014.1 putative P-loop containing nucleoside triphosphate hydrolase [Helianthus annuus]
MAVAELFMGAFITVLFEKLASGDLIRLARSAGIYSELNKWRNTLIQIQAVLADAGQKHIRDKSVQLWLNKLQHLAYEIDDVLDDLATKAIRSQLSKESSATTSKRTSREGDKESLLGKLLDNESSSSKNVNVVSIVGLGGIGKTTLAQLLCNDKKVKDNFELMAWVCISDDFDIFNISKGILQAVAGGNQDFANLNLLQVALAENLSRKRFLLVLDDVWNENYHEWELLQRPFNVGAPGSKILVTTRKTMVASMMDSIQTYPLQLLSNEDALSLFAQHASGKQNFDVNGILKSHGDDIVKKCGRLPLALRILGRLFRDKSNDDEWEALLNSEIWHLDNGSEILPALKLSYYDLSPHLKQLFAYCCLFPKDYMFEKDELILLWMAEGLLYRPNVKKSMESFGWDCFKELVSRSFLQHSNNDKSLYTMHDLMNDLAKIVAGEFFFMLHDKMDVDNKIEALEKSHHVSFIREEYEVYKI